MVTSFYLPLLFILPVFSILIFKLYKNYKKEKLRKEGLKNLINEHIFKINDALDYFKKKYELNEDIEIYFNIKHKTDFILEVIKAKTQEEQEKYLNDLFKMLYETEYRLIKNRYDIKSILAPLNSLCREIAEKQINYLRNHI